VLQQQPLHHHHLNHQLYLKVEIHILNQHHHQEMLLSVILKDQI
jgi:hypothetical protein